jgi:hypothetical protein
LVAFWVKKVAKSGLPASQLAIQLIYNIKLALLPFNHFNKKLASL